MPKPAYAFDRNRTFPGPVAAHVDRVIDGDTFEASAAIWIGQKIAIRVRIAGLDAPELRARCDAEWTRAEAARAWLAKRIAGGEVTLIDVHDDKYGGRIDARVTDAKGDIAAQMIRAGLARSYDGGHREGWC